MARLIKQNINIAFLIVGIAFLIWFGILGGGRDGNFGFDFSVMYAGGRAWLNGMNPYDQAQLSRVAATMKGFVFFWAIVPTMLLSPIRLHQQRFLYLWLC